MTHWLFREPGQFNQECHKSVFSSPKSAPAPVIREPDPLPPPPDRSDAETQNLADEQRSRLLPRRAGRASTFLTPSGVSAPSSAVRFLGSGAST